MSKSKLKTSVEFFSDRNKFRARQNGRHMGYYDTVEVAKAAAKVRGVTDLDNGRYRARTKGQHLGTFDTRTDAVKAVLSANTSYL